MPGGLRLLRGRVVDGVERRIDRAGRASVQRGLPPSWTGYRWVPHETVQEYFARHRHDADAGRYLTLHPAAAVSSPLPRNVASRDDLPDERGWWGFSFRDVPARVTGETFVATLPECRVVSYRDPAWDDDFYPAILTRDDRALDLREIRFRPLHGQVLRQTAAPVRMRRATWILERVYHNYSHWLTAHLPKILLLRERGGLDDVLLPAGSTSAIDASLRMVGLDPDRFRRYDEGRLLEVDELTVLGTDRFRPELVRLVQQAYADPRGSQRQGRVFISRRKATRRRLSNEDDVWAVFAAARFQRVFMEDLAFEEQVELMRATAVLVGAHGAGLTNMLFCSPGTRVVEIADLSFPNPNFYALASALGHPYWLVPAEAMGDAHPLERDLHVDPGAVAELLPELLA